MSCWYIFDRKTRECVATMKGTNPAKWDLDRRGWIAIQDVDGLGGPGTLMCGFGRILKKVMVNGT